MIAEPTSPDSGGVLPSISNVLVVMQGGLYVEMDQFFMKEVWWDYVRDRLLGLCDSMTLAAPVGTDSQRRFQHSMIDDRRVSVVQLPAWPAAGLVLAREVRRSDLVWIFMPTLRGFAAGAMCRAFGVPYVVYLGAAMDLSSRRVPAWLTRALGRELLRRAGAVVAAGGELVRHAQTVRSDVEATIPAVKISLAEVRETQRDLTLDRPSHVDWLYVGNLDRRKRPDVILAAFSKYRGRSSVDAKLQMYGGHPTDGILAMARELGIEQSVRWHGYVQNGPELFAAYRAGGVFVLASESEGFPRVLYEAMAFGLPIVTTPVGGVPYLLEDGRDCLLVPMGDPDAMATAVARLMSDHQLQSKLVRNGLRIVEAVVTADGLEQVHRLAARAMTGSQP